MQAVKNAQALKNEPCRWRGRNAIGGSRMPPLLSPCEKRWLTFSGVSRCTCSSSKGSGPQVAEKAQEAAKTKADVQQQTGPSKAEESEDDSDAEMAAVLAMDPVSVSVIEAQLTALFAMVVAGLLGGWLNIDPWSYYTWDWNAFSWSVEATIPLVLALVALSTVPTGVFSSPNQDQRELMSTAEDDSVVGEGLQLNIDLGYSLYPSMSLAKGGNSAEPQAATTQPLLSGLRLFQLFVTKPWFPEFSFSQLSVITASSAMQLTASELLARGLAVALIAGWAKDAVVSADQSSVLFWGKLFRLNTPETYRWFGTWVMAAASMWAATQEAARVQRWARLVLHRLDRRERLGDDPSPFDASSSASASISSSNSGQEGGQSVLQTVTRQLEVAPGTTARVTGTISRGAATSSSSSSSDASSSGQASSSSGSGQGSGDRSFDFTDPSTREFIQSITVEKDLETFQVNVNFVDETALPPTKEDSVVWSLAMLMGTAQVVLTAALFGATGTLVAPLTSRLLQEVAGNALVRYHARGGPPAMGDPVWRSGADRAKASKQE